MTTGNIEAFFPQDCIGTVGNRFGGAEATYLLCFRWALGVFHPEDTPNPSTPVLWELWSLFSPCVANYPGWGHSTAFSKYGDLVKSLLRCCVWSRESQGCYKLTTHSLATISPVLGWTVSSQIHVHLEPQNVTLFRNRVFADSIS